MEGSTQIEAIGARQESIRAASANSSVEGFAPWWITLNDVITLTVGAIVEGLRRHWLMLLNGVLGLIVGGALLLPVLYAVGAVGIATRLFTAYHLICAQIPTHSYFLFGYQLALCARNLAIYTSLLGGTLLFRYLRAWLPPLHWSLWLLTMAPMAWDGFTQMFGWRESNWELRTFTGVLFGLGVCWFLLPRFERAIRDLSASDTASNHGMVISPAVQ